MRSKENIKANQNEIRLKSAHMSAILNHNVPEGYREGIIIWVNGICIAPMLNFTPSCCYRHVIPLDKVCAVFYSTLKCVCARLEHVFETEI